MSLVVAFFVCSVIFLLTFNPSRVDAAACMNEAQVPADQSAEEYCSQQGRGGVDNGDMQVLGNDGLRVTSGCQLDGSSFFGLPTWYKYLDGVETGTGTCEPEFVKLSGNDSDVDVPNTAAAIGLAVFEIVLRVAGMLAIFFVIYGGIQYVISQGEPDKVKGARTTIINALVGVIIAIISVPIINLIGGGLGGRADVTDSGLQRAAADRTAIQTGLDIVFGVAGAIAVIMIILGGFQYVTSQGNPQNTSKAKNIILYALVGLVVIIFANAIVGFVLGEV